MYDFTFGFCIPNSTNSWEAIYDVPGYTKQQIEEYVSDRFMTIRSGIRSVYDCVGGLCCELLAYPLFRSHLHSSTHLIPTTSLTTGLLCTIRRNISMHDVVRFHQEFLCCELAVGQCCHPHARIAPPRQAVLDRFHYGFLPACFLQCIAVILGRKMIHSAILCPVFQSIFCREGVSINIAATAAVCFFP